MNQKDVLCNKNVPEKFLINRLDGILSKCVKLRDDVKLIASFIQGLSTTYIRKSPVIPQSRR